MLFNSLDFAIFLPIFFILYWYVTNRNLQLQNFLIVVASYIFYGWWDWRFLFLIFFSSITDYIIGKCLQITEKEKYRKTLLWISIVTNIGFLGFFKYYNFFVDSFVTAFSFFGKSISVNSLDIILPVGISFYTFQTLSYTIDVYKKKLEPAKDIISFLAFVSFFPQLVAGPIERATNLLPQFYKKRVFEYDKAVDGMRQMLWGLFKKVVIADNCAEYANAIFNNYTDFSGSTLVLGAIFFTFQIYCDFSGYSDMAIGMSRLFGFDLMKNFAFPYFSRDIAEFWRRWHISLSTWFRDYLYIPLGGSKGSLLKIVRNTFIIFLVSGFWHGANWTFIIWGFLNALYFLPLLLVKRNRRNLDIVAQNRVLPTIKELLSMLTTFFLTVFAWIFFRAESVSQAFSYINRIFTKELLKLPIIIGSGKKELLVILLTMIFVIIEWIGRRNEYAIEKLFISNKRWIRWGFYYIILLVIFLMAGKEQEFIYFQF
jgi:alginate O-acetylation protein